MNMDKRVAILIPAYNEEVSLPGVLEELIQYPVDIVVVDDGSEDGTIKKLTGLPIHLLSTSKHGGKGLAFQIGLNFILTKIQPEWVLFMDGDGQHLPSEVPRFLNCVDTDSGIIIGDRSAREKYIPLKRRLTIKIGSKIMGAIAKLKLNDSQCGFRMYRTKILSNIKIESKGFEIDTELLLKAIGLGARAEFIPVTPVYHNGNRSKFQSVKDTFAICMATLRFAPLR